MASEEVASTGSSSTGTAGSSGTILLSDQGAGSIRELVGISNLEGENATDPPLTGDLTRLVRPRYLEMDSAVNALVVCDEGATAVLFFNDPTNIDGNVPPQRVLTGPATELVTPVQAFVDTTNDELYILDRGSNSVLVYAEASTVDGDVAPVRRISGATTGITTPNAFLFVPSDDRMLVLNGTEILTFEEFSTANGAPAPIGRVSGGATTFVNLVFGALDANGGLLLADAGSNSLLYFENFEFDGNLAPSNTVSGPNTGITSPGQFALTADGDLYLANGTEVLFFQDIAEQEGGPFPDRRFTALNPTLSDARGLVIP